MRIPQGFTPRFRQLAGFSPAVLGLALGLMSSCAVDDGSDDAAASDSAGDAGDDVATAVCTTGRYRCHARMRTAAAGRITPHAAAATPQGYGAADLQAAYNLNPAVTATASPTVAIVDAFGYAQLEADLAIYRTQYGLPACTVASGCLKIVNQGGKATPLPPDPPLDNDWRAETALDVDMVSAACPKCKILVVQASDDTSAGLLYSQTAAATLGAAVISNSWGGPESGGIAQTEPFFDQPGIAIFVSAGDDGYNDQLSGTAGPDYPGTSAHVIAVGGTRLVRDSTTTRGWRESTWAPGKDPKSGAGGSACSTQIAKPAYQSASPCQFKATVDVAAVGDPQTGVAVYTSAGQRGWTVVGGTSASAPFVAAIVAASGNGAQTSGAFFGANTDKLWDVTTGTNGTCGGQTLLCNAAVGWDGPTGFGTPNGRALLGMPGTSSDSGSGGTDPGGVDGGCSTGGAGAGLLVGVVLLGLGRRRQVTARTAAATN